MTNNTESRILHQFAEALKLVTGDDYTEMASLMMDTLAKLVALGYTMDEAKAKLKTVYLNVKGN